MNSELHHDIRTHSDHEAEGAYEVDQVSWMTIGKIAEYLGKSYDWVQVRVKQYTELAESRPDSQGRVRVYFPGTVTSLLQKELAEVTEYPMVGPGDISLHGLSIALGRDEKWIQARVSMLHIQGTVKIHPANNRPFTYFSEERDLPLLANEDERVRSYPVVQDEDISVDGIARVIDKAHRSVHRRLMHIPVFPSVKMNSKNNQLGLYYNREEIFDHLAESVSSDAEVTTHPSVIDEDEGEEQKAASRHKKTNYDMPTTDNWREYALCAEVDPGLFVASTMDRTRVALAKKICNECVARTFCLDWAVANNERDGVWGGMSARERRGLVLN